MLTQYGLTDHTPLQPGDRGDAPTRQTVRRNRRNSVQRLIEGGALSDPEIAAAQEIMLVVEALSRAPTRSAFDPMAVANGPSVRRRPLAGFLPEFLRPKQRRYADWAKSMRLTVCGRGAAQQPLLTIVLRLLMDGWSYRAIERDLGLRCGAGYPEAMLRFALRRYALAAGWMRPTELS